MSDRPDKSSGFFQRFNAIVDVHMAELSGPEFKALMAFVRYADAETGVGFPGAELVGKKMHGVKSRTSKRNAEKAIASLRRRGFLITMSGGRGRGDATYRKIVIPERPAHCAGDKRPAQEGTKDRRKSTQKTGANQPERPAQEDGRMAHVPTHGTHQQHQGSADDAGGGFSGKEEEADKPTDRTEKSEAYYALARHKISEPTRSKLLREIPNLTAEAIDEIADDIEGDYGPGLLVENIRADGADTVERQREEAEHAARRAARREKILAPYYDLYLSDPDGIEAERDTFKGDVSTAILEEVKRRMKEADVDPPDPKGPERPALVAWLVSLYRNGVRGPAGDQPAYVVPAYEQPSVSKKQGRIHEGLSL